MFAQAVGWFPAGLPRDLPGRGLSLWEKTVLEAPTLASRIQQSTWGVGGGDGGLLIEKQWVPGLNLIGAVLRCVAKGQEITSLCLY